ncbi:hypothetical protein BHE74_00007381 [Ensete ventricosum]|nr:hypothetical protein BHE74_00007381 [Ensete ventricosum]
MDPIRCPENSFAYDSTLCACNPGYYKDRSGGCRLFEAGDGDWTVGTRAGPAGPTFLDTVLPLESLEWMVRSEEALLRAVLVVTLFWLAFCVAVRFGSVDGGRTIWFRIRWSVAQLDLFATHHDRVRFLSSFYPFSANLPFYWHVDCAVVIHRWIKLSLPHQSGRAVGIPILRLVLVVVPRAIRGAHSTPSSVDLLRRAVVDRRRRTRDDNKVVKKRKAELGGTFSVVSWILFIGLLSA